MRSGSAINDLRLDHQEAIDWCMSEPTVWCVYLALLGAEVDDEVSFLADDYNIRALTMISE